MEDPWLKKWNDRYREEAFAYGTEPNAYLKEKLEPLEAGNILFPAEGEGRNAAFAAGLGWTVSAFDISEEGRKKALRLADDRGVKIDYRVGKLEELDYTPGQFDALALIYAHFPPTIKSTYHRLLNTYLRKGGLVIFEAFGKRHLGYNSKNPAVGGPKAPDVLFSTEELEGDFAGFDFLELGEHEVELNEGLFHNGTGSVIRFVGRKK